MISFFRRALSSWLVLGLLGLILIAFIITGVGGPSAGRLVGPRGDSIATVGGSAIATADVEQAAKRQVEAAQQQNPGLDMATFVATGGFTDTVDQIIASRALQAFALRQGMAASRALVDGDIAGIPGLRGLDGKVDGNAFAGFLEQQHLSEAQLRELVAADTVRRQLVFPVIGGARVPTGLATPYASLLLEARDGMIGIVPSSAMAGGTPPSEAEIAAYFHRNIAAYTLPERRVLRYAAFGLGDVAAKAAPSDAEIAAYYKANAATYAQRETRDLSQVVLDSEAKARAFAARLAAGTPFDKAAADAGFGPADTKLGRKTAAEFAALASPAVAGAAFAAKQEGIAGPAKSAFGWHVVRINAVETIPDRPLAAVHGEIAAQLGKQKSQAALTELAGAAEDAISGGASFDAVVKAKGLKETITPPLLPDGSAPDTPGWEPPPEVKALLKAAFETSPDEDPTVETIAPNTSFALLAVNRVVPSAAQPLGAVHARVADDLGAERAQQRAKAVATAILAKADAGVALPAAFAEAAVKLPPPQRAGGKRIDLARATRDGRVPPALAMLFTMKQGTTKILEAPAKQGWLVIHVDRIVPGDAAGTPALIEATRGQLVQAVGEEYLEQFAHAAQAVVGVKRNEAAIARLKAQLGGGASDAQ